MGASRALPTDRQSLNYEGRKITVRRDAATSIGWIITNTLYWVTKAFHHTAFAEALQARQFMMISGFWLLQRA